MNKAINNHKILMGALLAALLVIIGAGAFMIRQNAARIDKETVLIGSPSWMSHTFESAAEKAATIVYGEVRAKGEMQGSSACDYSTDVTVDVIEWAKRDMESNQIIFLEMGGETKTKIYTYEGIDPVQIGDRYVFFLNEYGAFLNPYTLVPVNNGNISMNESIFPERKVRTGNGSGTDEIPVEYYLEAVREICGNASI